MRTLDLFAGIGGFSLAAHWMGWQTAAFVEWDPFCQKVLAKNFPGVPIFGNIKDFHYEQEKERIRPIDLVCGGFPCQPFSHAGKRNGTADDRYLWPEMLRVIGEVKPAWVVGENVAGLLSMDGGAVFESVCASLEAKGYAVEAFVLPAISRGAPHRRDRVWIVAHARSGDARRTPGGLQSSNGGEGVRQEQRVDQSSGADQVHGFTADASGSGTGVQNGESESGRQRRESGRNSQSQMVRPGNGEVNAEGFESCDRDTTNSDQSRLQSDVCGQLRSVQSEARSSQGRELGRAITKGEQWREHWYEAATRLCGIHDGLSRGVDRNKRLKALGNAIVPQIVYEIFRAIEAHELSIKP